MDMNSQDGTLITASYSPYTGGGITYATGAAAVPAAGGAWYQNPLFWILIIAGAVVIARR
jgi:hypothetical protein